MNQVITIGREFGSGGHEIGLKLAQHLGIPFYDNEIISLAAKESNMAEKFFEQAEDNPPNRYFRPTYMVYEIPMSDQVFLSQSRVIKYLAEKGPCVIVGRCADYVLSDHDTIDLFIYAPMEERIHRKLSMDIGVPPEKMEAHIKSVDKKRAKYYNYYTDNRWGEAKNYNLCINSGKIGVDGSVTLIEEYLRLFYEK